MVKFKTVEPKEVCKKCGKTTKHEIRHYFCDNCDKEMSENLGKGELNITLFYNDDGTKDFYFCTWKCVFDWLKGNKKRFRAEGFNFLTMPYVTSTRQAEFFKQLRNSRVVVRK